MLISACAMRELSHRLAHVRRPEVVRDLVDQRRHHLFTRIAAAHPAAHATLGGNVHGAHLPASPARVAPDARAARGFKEARGGSPRISVRTPPSSLAMSLTLTSVRG